MLSCTKVDKIYFSLELPMEQIKEKYIIKKKKNNLTKNKVINLILIQHKLF